jgi:light-regulated signal transduction histidine kinase (bacteriophytochrome)
MDGVPITEYSFRVVRPDGEIRYVNSQAQVQFDQDQRPIRMVGVTQDVTERKAIEDELAKHRQSLEELVASRTKELETINKELESFSYSVSHDLRAPLRAIDGFSHALLDDYQEKLDETGKDYLQRVCNSAHRMGDLIDDLLGLSRVTRHNLNRITVDMSALAESVIAELKAGDPDRSIETSIMPGIMGYGDKNMLRVVLSNLLGNAWKYTSNNDGAKIEFGFELRDGEKVYYVRDNGVGFDMSHSDKLFGAFQRLHRRDEFEGTGIGLATVQRVIHRHGGEIWAEAEVGQGAVFYFTLENKKVDD